MATGLSVYNSISKRCSLRYQNIVPNIITAFYFSFFTAKYNSKMLSSKFNYS